MTTTTPPLTLESEGNTNIELDKLDELLSPFDEARFLEELPAGPLRNARRASFAASALRAYAECTGTETEPLEQNLRDLLTDLRHLCDLLDDDTFDNLSDRAASGYGSELPGE